jgi:hypothetical protein
MTNKRLDDLLEKARNRTKAGITSTPASTQKAKQLALPFWPEQVRSVPNAVLRGALFTVSKERAVLKDLTHIASVDGIEIRAKNDRLNQVDLDLWEMLLHLQRLQPLGNRVEFTAYSMLKALGRTTGGKDHHWLDNALARLIGSVVEIKWTRERKAFAGALVSSFFRDDEIGRYVVKFNQDMATLYGQGHTYIDWEQRQSLGQNSLAKWLHGFYTTHAAPFPYKVETLQKLCGSSATLREFRRLLKAALTKLVGIGAISDWEINADSDLVTVDKKSTSTQKRYLERSKTR